MSFPALRQQGFTLVELMVAMTLGAILLLLLAVLFATSQQQFRLHTQLTELQDNANGAIQALSKELRVAGYVGCVSESAVTSSSTFGLPFVQAYSTMAAYQAGVSPARSAISSSAFSGVKGPILEVTHASYRSLPVQSVSSSSIQLTRDPYGWFDALPGSTTRKVILSNCGAVKAFTVQWTASGGVITLSPSGGFNPVIADSVPPQAQVFSRETSTFFLATPTGGSAPSLYQRFDDGRSIVDLRVADNVQEWGLTFSVADATGAITSVTRSIADLSNFADWQSVQSVQVRLLLRSSQKVVPSTSTYLSNFVEVTASDQFLRKEVVSTIAIRNRASERP